MKILLSQNFVKQTNFDSFSKTHNKSTTVLGCASFASEVGYWLGKSVTISCPIKASFCFQLVHFTITHNPLLLRSTIHNYFLAKFKTEKKGPNSGWVTSVVCQQVARLLIGHLPLIYIISFQGAAPAGQRLGNMSCSQGYLQSTGSCSKESLKRSTEKGKLEGRQGKNRGKEPISDLSITDVTNQNLVHRVLGKEEKKQVREKGDRQAEVTERG